MTKELPTTAPEGFSVKTAQLENGVYNCYLVPNTWAASNATYGRMPMDNVFNWGEGLDSQYEIYFADAAVSVNNEVVDNVATGDGDLEVLSRFIDNETGHNTYVAYNYGDISSVYHKNYAAYGDADYRVVVPNVEFTTVFNCIYNDTYTWHWGTIEEIAKEFTAIEGEGDNVKGWPVKDTDGNYVNKAPSTDLTYDENYTMSGPLGEFGFEQVIFGVSSRDSEYSAPLYRPYAVGSDVSLDYVEDSAQIITKANGEVDEYFKVVEDPTLGYLGLKFEPTKTESSSNPVADVPSTVRLQFKDMYGHDVYVEVDVTVKPRQ